MMSALARLRPPPGPRGYPGIGVFLRARRDPLAFLLDAAQRYGDVVAMRFGRRPVCLVTHPDLLKHILHDNHSAYGKTLAASRVSALFGNSLTTVDGDRWQQQRRRMRPAFHARRQVWFASVVVDATAEMLARWQCIASHGGTVDPLGEMTALTRAIVLRMLFGDLEAVVTTELGDSLDVVLQHVDRRLWSVFGPVAAPTGRQHFQRGRRTIDTLVARMIGRAHEGALPPDSMLATLCTARDAVTGTRMNDVELRDEIKAIMVAGHTTLASALAWVWYVLSEHAAAAQRLRNELNDILGGRAPSADDVTRLEYTRRLVAEVLRLYPPTWMTARTALEDDELAGYRIPRGTIVIMSPFLTQRHPRFWAEPERFDPDRFLPARIAQRSPFAYVPFGRGPRSCIGSSFALVEMQLVVAMVAQRYRLSRVLGPPVGFDPGLTLRPHPRVPMVLHDEA